MNSVLPKVSVVTITYGHEKYITETLDGVLMQQYKGPVEFIIANDNSPDATDKVVKKYFLENPAPSNFEIKYTKHETNKGMMPNFIWALEQATGKYIALCEGDDYWTDPLKLQKQFDFMESNSNLVMCFHGALVKDISGKLKPYYKHKNFINKSLVSPIDFLSAGGGSYPTNSTFIKTLAINILLNEKPQYFMKSPVGDFPLALFLITQGDIGYISDVMSVYRFMHEDSWSKINDIKTKLQQHRDTLFVINEFNEHNRFLFDKVVRNAKMNIYRNLADAYTINLSFTNALLKHIKLYPKMGLRNILPTLKGLLYKNLQTIKKMQLFH